MISPKLSLIKLPHSQIQKLLIEKLQYIGKRKKKIF